MTVARAKRVKPSRPITVGFLGPGVDVVGDLVDLSESGALMRCAQYLSPDTVGHLGIDVGNEVLKTTAVVRRHVPGVGTAFAFDQLSARTRDVLKRFLFRMEWDTAW